MVHLTITPTIVAAIKKCESLAPEEFQKLQHASEPSLRDPSSGMPISHSQLIDISKLLKQHISVVNHKEENTVPAHFRLQDLLRGTHIYIPPPPPKPEPSSEYKALMARLRKDEESRAYERMISSSKQPETFSQRYPVTPNARFNPTATDVEEDDVTYAEVKRQVALIFNVLVSIIACSVAIWLAASHWSAPKRLGLSMTGSGVVAIAEVVIYSGYIRRIKEAKTTEKAKKEVKEISESWVIEAKKGGKMLLMKDTSLNNDQASQVRLRPGKQK